MQQFDKRVGQSASELRVPVDMQLLQPGQPQVSSCNGGGLGTGQQGGQQSHGSDKEFSLNIDRVMQGLDRRTTLMIRNIPNKYTQVSNMLFGD